MKKIYKRCLHENLINCVHTVLSKFISAYTKYYSSNHFPIRLIEIWEKFSDHKMFVGAVPMDLSKVFDSIPDDLLAKMNVTVFQEFPRILSFILKMKKTKR